MVLQSVPGQTRAELPTGQSAQPQIQPHDARSAALALLSLLQNNSLDAISSERLQHLARRAFLCRQSYRANEAMERDWMAGEQSQLKNYRLNKRHAAEVKARAAV